MFSLSKYLHAVGRNADCSFASCDFKDDPAVLLDFNFSVRGVEGVGLHAKRGDWIQSSLGDLVLVRLSCKSRERF
jgi:hypothetical protein